MSRAFSTSRTVATALWGSAMVVFMVGFLSAATALASEIKTNQSYIRDVLAPASFDINRIDDVFDHIFSSLDGEVTVYPTENYYYFKFLHEGVPYAGNFRLDIADRDQGIIHFAYFSENNPFTEQAISHHRAYNSEFGVTVEKNGELVYAVTRNGRTVVFELNDLRGVEPAEQQIGPGEVYLGPVFDESGVQMFLLWNPDLKMFLYILDETVASEQHFQSDVSSQIKIGYRSSFAYYADRYLDRWILVGVRAAETMLNTYFDGPFDQLPDNFIKGNALGEALVALSPEVEGQIDRLGNSEDLTGRMLVDPYVLYEEEADLALFDDCAAAAVDTETYYPCFAIGQTK
ncbi:hypothetical protein PZ897_03920 [Hoeflea sp. YIM 152468]|uniref:hypothetical protein n=1 Tax=Hoeflea sp. YIM 152468 TaxID=3031759 RepID=UPI0023DB3EA1|nr:hypothetical protein [Hoeflea sp. YIM 152468]MDF1607319.1 hypothetical protein [Hoeflea sp. YIM 152468]